MNKRLKNWFLGLVALLALVIWSPAQAAIVTEFLSVEVISGPGLGETGAIDVTYDNTDLITGDELLPQTSFSLSLTIFGQTFINSDDVSFPGWPKVKFIEGSIEFIDFHISERSFFDNPTAIIDPRIGKIRGGFVVGGTWGVDTLSPVPVPAAAWLFGSALLGLGAVKRRKASALNSLRRISQCL